MPYCWKCGAELDKDAKFCSKCGASAGPAVTRPEIRETRRGKRKPLSTLTIVLIVLLVAVVVVPGVLAAAFFLGVWHPFGQVVGSENLVTREEFFSDFSVVDVGSGFDVEITQSNSYSIKITADDNVFDYVEVFNTSDTLTIRLKWGYSYQSVTLSAKVTMPELYELDLSRGTHGLIRGFSFSHGFVAELSLGSSLGGDFVTSGDVEFVLSGGSQVAILDGAADDLRISASGGSQLGLSRFRVHDASVSLSGGSQATINLDGRLDASLSGGSQLAYIGDPTMGDIDTTGGSTVSKKQ